MTIPRPPSISTGYDLHAQDLIEGRIPDKPINISRFHVRGKA